MHKRRQFKAAKEFLARIAAEPIPQSPPRSKAPSPPPANPQPPQPRSMSVAGAPSKAATPEPPKPDRLPRTADPAVRLAKRRRRRKRYEEKHLKPHIPAVLEVLSQRWPAAFPEDPSRYRPWAIGIHEDIMRSGNGLVRSWVRAALKYVTKTVAYLSAVAAGGSRYDLEGNPRGDVTPADMAEAAARLAELTGRLP